MKNRIYPVNERIFANIVTEPVAYALGFIAADGCVHKNRICLALRRADEDHISTIAAILESGHPIRRYDAKSNFGTFPASRLTICSKLLVSDLAAAGVTPRKSLTIKPWNGPTELMPHWWRGIIDGNGTWTCDTKRVRLSLIGNPYMIQGFVDFVKSHGATPDQSDYGKVQQARVSRMHHVKHLATVLYAGATVWLQRKYEKVQAVLSRTKSCKDWNDITKEQLLEAHARLGTWRAVGKELGIPSPGNVHSLCKQRNILTKAL